MSISILKNSLLSTSLSYIKIQLLLLELPPMPPHFLLYEKYNLLKCFKLSGFSFIFFFSENFSFLSFQHHWTEKKDKINKLYCVYIFSKTLLQNPHTTHKVFPFILNRSFSFSAFFYNQEKILLKLT